jgi:hypothetical protein
MIEEKHGALTHRTSVCLVGLTGPPFEALRYLITHLNELQGSLEFELLSPAKDDPLVKLLLGPQPVRVDKKFNQEIKGFADRLDKRTARDEVGFKLQAARRCNYVVVSLAQLSNKFYAWDRGRTSVLALGDWERSLAPPSLVEYALALVLRLAAGYAVPKVEKAKHLATRGCVFDFNPNLQTVRLKVLNSFICSDCTKALTAAKGEQFAEDLLLLLGKTWLGDMEEPRAPAALCRKLGYDLFLTKGIQPSLFQTLSAKLQGDLVAEILKLITAVILAYLLFRLGLSAGGND